MIYLDNAATSFPKPEPVYQALDHFARTSLANPGRAGHRMAFGAERMLDATRHALNQFFGGEAPERWILTHNCTDGLNLAIKGIVAAGRSRRHDRPRAQLDQPAAAGPREGRRDQARRASRPTPVTSIPRRSGGRSRRGRRSSS